MLTLRQEIGESDLSCRRFCQVLGKADTKQSAKNTCLKPITSQPYAHFIFLKRDFTSY